MSNPFRKFRKHQKVWLAALALMAMISFVVLPIIADLLSSSPVKDSVVVSTRRYGSLQESRVHRLRADREILRGFFEHLAQSAMQAGGDGRALASIARILGPAGEEEVVETWLLANRANELGIVVSDEEINQFLNSLTTQQKVSRETVQEVMQYRHISENDLFRMLRNELLALRIQQLFLVSLNAVTPAQRWDYYRQLNEKTRIEVAALPASDFISQVTTPDDKTLLAFYNDHKQQLEDPTSPTPGFREPQKIALKYFKANLDAVAVSNAEIEKYYEENKDKEFVEETLPEIKEDTSAPKEEPKADEKKPESAAQPAQETPPGQEEASKAEPAPPAPASEAQPAEKPEEPKAEPPKEEAAKEEAAKDETSAVKRASPFRMASYQEEKKPEEAKAEPQPAEQPAETTKPEASAPEVKPEEKAEAPAAEEKAEEAKADQKPAAPPKYVPLEKAKVQIRAILAAQKIEETLAKVQDQLNQYFEDVTLYEAHLEDKDTTVKPPQEPDYAAIAKEHGLGFYKTDLISPLQVNQLDIGQSIAGPATPFLRHAFETLAKNKPETSQDTEGNHFLYWKTGQADERTPEFTEPGVRERVLQAWKMVQASKLAESKARELAEKANNDGKSLKEFFADQPKIVVRESEPFSWMTYGSIPGWWSQMPPQLSRIVAAGEKKDGEEASPNEIVDMPGNGFMRAVFSLNKGQAGVAVNQPRTVVYVVRVIDTTEPVWQAFTNDDFSRYARVGDQDQRATINAWRQSLKSEVGFEWKREPAHDQRNR